MINCQYFQFEVLVGFLLLAVLMAPALGTASLVAAGIAVTSAIPALILSDHADQCDVIWRTRLNVLTLLLLLIATAAQCAWMLLAAWAAYQAIV